MLPLLSPVYAKSPFTLLNNKEEGLKLLASIQVSETPGLFLKNTPKSAPLALLTISPLEATKSAVKDKKISTTRQSDIKERSEDLKSESEASLNTLPSSTGGLNADILFNMANAHRKSLNLPPFQKDDRACTVAKIRAPQVLGELYGGVMHQGLRDMNLPYWNRENIISMRSNDEAFNWWITDEIHKEAIEGNYKYSCVACSGQACAEEFTDFIPK